jgi:hypothetical protein
MPRSVASKAILGLLALALLGLAVSRWYGAGRRASPDALGSDAQVAEISRQVAAIEAREAEAARTVWAKEMLAQRCGQVFEQLWDTLNYAANAFEVIEAFPVERLLLPEWASSRAVAHGVREFAGTGRSQTLTRELWRARLQALSREGWRLAQTEIRQVQFDTDDANQPRRSRFYFSAHLTHTSREDRAALDGDLVVDWVSNSDPAAGPVVQQIDASALTLTTRTGAPPFREVLVQAVAPPSGSFFIDPLLVYDLDGDGASEVVLAASNLVLRRRGADQFEASRFCAHDLGLIFTGLLADLDGDAEADFLYAKFEGLFWVKGSPGGRFDQPPQQAWAAEPRLRYAQALTCGDIDGDGDLDVWLGQYKLPYIRGQMPTPYFDANDGYPSYLLRHDGQGHFTDITTEAGLQAKRWRRVYGASLVDLDADGDLDLAVAADFAGLDLYANDGQGRFTEVTRAWTSERYAFGMSQVTADFNRDGVLDLLMVGMNVPVMDRLRHLGRARPGFEHYLGTGTAVADGNRLYLGQGGGRLRPGSLSGSIARTGWSWGAGVFDFDNDGFPDIYLANGHETKQSVRDYETEFWLHDIYVGNSQNNLAAATYFQRKHARTRGKGMSYGGYEKNRLYLNVEGDRFVEIAHLMGVALQEDSRNVVAEDFDGDGRVDLVVTTFEVWPEVRQTVRIFRNVLETGSNWIGIRLREEGRGCSPVAARVTIRYGGRTALWEMTTGDSYRSQRPTVAHFGLGNADFVESVEVRWANAQSITLRGPAINQYHGVKAPSTGQATGEF